MISHTQTLDGVTSKIGKDLHIIMWDLENCSLTECEDELRRIQNLFGLSDIFIVSDRELSYRAYCYNIVPFKYLLMVLCATKYVDWNFIRWSVVRGKATLRVSQKYNRKPQRLVSYLPSYVVPIPQTLPKVIYDTGYNKRGKVFSINAR